MTTNSALKNEKYKKTDTQKLSFALFANYSQTKERIKRAETQPPKRMLRSLLLLRVHDDAGSQEIVRAVLLAQRTIVSQRHACHLGGGVGHVAVGVAIGR